ncbi:hypothetical protein [Amycolatopsis sp. WGS_07]|uniref:hypothetical protein n=1 Tax=Amycolatopsis sp. WGS_07 TaxID=3076764 RepID=UPI00387327FD
MTMVVFAFVVLGFVAGYHVVRTFDAGKDRTRAQELGVLGLLATAAALGWLAWLDSRSEGTFTFVSAVFDDLHQVAGVLGDIVAAAVLLVTVITVALGFLAMAASVLALPAIVFLVCAAFLRALSGPDADRPAWFSELYGSGDAGVSPRNWEAGVRRYGGAVAAGLAPQAVGRLSLRVCGPHPAHLHISYDHVLCGRVRAHWDVVGGWSASVGRRQYRFGRELVPAPAEVGRWLWAVTVASSVRHGIAWPREWHAGGEAEAIRQALLRAQARTKRPEIPRQPGAAEDSSEGTEDSA